MNTSYIESITVHAGVVRLDEIIQDAIEEAVGRCVNFPNGFFDDDGELSFATRTIIADKIRNGLSTARIKVHAREKGSVGAGIDISISALTSLEVFEKLDSKFKKTNADVICERVEVKTKGGAVAGFKTE